MKVWHNYGHLFLLSEQKKIRLMSPIIRDYQLIKLIFMNIIVIEFLNLEDYLNSYMLLTISKKFNIGNNIRACVQD